MSRKQAVIIGAGPAGLTAAYELIKRTDIIPIILEKSDCVGGLSRTINYKGNRIDIGGHRFFSKSDRVMQWWQEILPINQHNEITLSYQNNTRTIVPQIHPVTDEKVMLVRQRKSRILFNRRLFEYPLSLSVATIKNLGLWRTARIGTSYARAAVAPIAPEENLEQFFINRFGRELYHTFFKSYTEKVWGVPCHQISAAWGAQRVKGFSIAAALKHYFTSMVKKSNDIAQKDTETTLIQQFLYPKYGPGQLWEEVAERVMAQGGKLYFNTQVAELVVTGDRVKSVSAYDAVNNQKQIFSADYVFSTMPVKELTKVITPAVPAAVGTVSDQLMYRDFITIGVLTKRFMPHAKTPLTDNWIYIQEPDVQVGRIQIFNNWSPYMVADPSLTWVGLEYFCFDSDTLWQTSENELIELACNELVKLRLVNRADIVDATVIKVEKTYPAYFGSYHQFDQIRSYVDHIKNLFLIGRNGMHKYNNQDHSMLTAMVAVDAIIAGSADKTAIWAVNTEQEYHESKQ